MEKFVVVCGIWKYEFYKGGKLFCCKLIGENVIEETITITALNVQILFSYIERVTEEVYNNKSNVIAFFSNFDGENFLVAINKAISLGKQEIYYVEGGIVKVTVKIYENGNLFTKGLSGNVFALQKKGWKVSL